MTYTKDSLRQIFQQPFNAKEWQQMLQHFFRATELKSEPEPIDGTTEDEQGYYLGAIDTTDSYRIGLFYYQIQHSNVARKRVGLRNLVKSFVNPNWGEFDATLAVFDSDSDIIVNSKFVNSKSLWRLSFVCDIKGENTAAKRFTYVFGESDNYYNTPVGRFDALQRNGISFENIKEAFSVERLNKDFFNGYKERYVKFLNHINDDTKENRDYVKKLLGRLVFLQFLQKKGWMGVPASQQGWNGGDKFYLNHLIERYEGNDRLLSDILEPLFFNTLNERRAGDLADSRLGENIKIPYLNGGLFDKDELDKIDIDFPYDYFKELMDFFAMYNFTIDENDPEDSEIGIDPEMLGHIFENLLEDNKDKGAFYTPKEIVQYMSKESVAQYLKSKTPGELHTAIDSLIKQRVVEPVLQNKENARLVNRALSDVKVCDPAIGSGAFPMGVLNVLFDCRHLLYGFIGKKEVFSYAKVKRDIIQNNIYGVDIEKGAVDIARLRFWLALVVDENEPQPLPNLDFKIMQGNSLLEQYEDIDLSKLSDAGWSMKIVQPQADLFGHIDDPQLKLTFSSETHTLDLQNKITRYFSIDDHDEKIRLFHDIEEDVRQNILYNIEMRQRQAERIVEELKTYPTLDKKQLKEKAVKEEAIARYKEMMDDVQTMLFPNDKFFLWHTYYKDVFDQGGFDIVIGNPPYLRIQGLRNANSKLVDTLIANYKSATGSFDFYVCFVEIGLRVISKTGLVNFIMPVKWSNASFGKGIRKLISSNKYAKTIINFGEYQVFNASTYTALQWFSPNSQSLAYNELDRDLPTNQELKQYLDNLSGNNFTQIDSSKLTEDTWVLTSGSTNTLLAKLDRQPRRVGDVFDKIFQGLATSKDDVYFLQNCSQENGIVKGYSPQLDKEIQVETGLVRPLLKGEDVHRYDVVSTHRVVIFPYKVDNGKADLYSEQELATLFPKGYSYLKECESVLRNREKGRLLNDECWFRYIYPKNLVLFDKEKLVAPEISMGGNFSYDVKGNFYSTTKIYGYIKNSKVLASYKSLMAILNSKIMWFFMSNTGYVLRGGYFTFKTNYVTPFPMPSDASILSIERQLEELVDKVTEAKSEGKTEEIYIWETAIDLLVYHLYGLTYDEVIIIDPETPIIREEYEK